MPSVEGAVEPSQKQSFEVTVSILRGAVQPWDMTILALTSYVGLSLLSLHSGASRSRAAQAAKWVVKDSTFSRLASPRAAVPQNFAA